MQLANPQPITPAELVQLTKSSKGKIRHLYLHWTAGRYKQVFDDYHLSIDGEGNIDKLSETASADEVMAAAQAFADLMEEDVLNNYVLDKNEVIAG